MSGSSVVETEGFTADEERQEPAKNDSVAIDYDELLEGVAFNY